MFRGERSEQGAVTVFLTMIFAVVFAFVAIFIDYARMAALQSQSEASAHAAVRSVLSSYDQELLNRYGLFAYGETDENYIMTKVLQDQQETAKRSDRLTIVGAKLDSSSIELQRPLGTYPVFEQQIREQMKYKAPIDFTLEIFDRMKPVSGVMKEASATMDLMGKLQKLFEQREEALDQALAAQRQAAGTVRGATSVIPAEATGYIGDESLGGPVSTLKQGAAVYQDYQIKWEEDQQRDPLERMYTFELMEYRSSVSHLLSTVSTSHSSANSAHSRLLPEAEQHVERARELNSQMEKVIQESEQRPALGDYNKVSSAETAGLQVGDVPGSQEINKIRQQARSLLRENGDFDQMLQIIQKQRSSFSSWSAVIGGLSGLNAEMLSASSSVGTVKSKIINAATTSDSFIRAFVAPSGENILDQQAKALESHRAHEGERKSLEKQAKGQLKEANNMLKNLANLNKALDQHQQSFDQLKGYYKANVQFNSEAEQASNDQQKVEEDVYSKGSESMGQMDQLYGGLAGIMASITDDCYQTEYTADYFHPFDVTKLSSVLKGGSEAALAREQFAPEHQEMEYILYGFHNPTGNILAAYSEIFGMRLAIRTMEGFIQNANKGHPLIILVAALLYGLEHAIQDMLMLTQKGSIPLSKYMDVELTYRDYLRIFLLMHGTSNARLSRMLALIQHNTSIDPSKRATYISGEVTTSIHLLFLPGVAKAMNMTGALKGRVEGSRYYAIKQADFSY